MRDLFARVSIERDDYRRSLLGGQKTLTVTGTVDGETEQTTVTLEEIDRKTATLFLDSDIETSTLPRETKNVTIRVLDGDTVIHETTKTATLPRTEPGHAC
jgi:stress response protein SCP2